MLLGWGPRRRYPRQPVGVRPRSSTSNVGIIVAPRGRLMVAMTFTFRNGKVAELGIITDRERLRQLDITI